MQVEADTLHRQPYKATNRRPKFVDPTRYLNPALQNMFVLGYMSNGKEMIPTGWNSVDEDKTYPTLSSRSPQLPQEVDDNSSNGSEASEQNSSESSEDTRFPNNHFATRMNEESDEDEPEVKVSNDV